MIQSLIMICLISVSALSASVFAAPEDPEEINLDTRYIPSDFREMQKKQSIEDLKTSSCLRTTQKWVCGVGRVLTAGLGLVGAGMSGISDETSIIRVGAILSAATVLGNAAWDQLETFLDKRIKERARNAHLIQANLEYSKEKDQKGTSNPSVVLEVKEN